MDVELGRRLEVLRERADLSQDELATRGRALGEKWSRSTVAKWERGQRDLPVEEFFTLAIILGIPLGKSLRELVPDPDPAVSRPEEAEQKAARSLRITAAEVSKLARRRWKATLTAERERRLARQLRGKGEPTARARQAMRGRVTRTLLAELRAEIDGAKTRRRKGR